MTFEQYIKNPMGTHNTVMAHREMYKKMYTDKWDILMVREASKIEYKVFKNDTDYIIYIKIPSEVIEKFYYDVVINFKQTIKGSLETTIKNYDVEFFSNDPSFVFTFAHAFIKNKIFFEDMKPRMSKKAIKEKAKITNPKHDIGYVKSLYFAYLAMNNKGLFTKAFLDSVSSKYNKEGLLSIIMDADKKIEKRQSLSAEKSIKKNKPKKDQSTTSKPKSNNDSIKQTVILGSIKNTKKIDTIKSAINKTKTTNKIKKR